MTREDTSPVKFSRFRSSLCINMLCCVDFQKCLNQHVLDSLDPYGGINNNQLSKTCVVNTTTGVVDNTTGVSAAAEQQQQTTTDHDH